MSYFFEGMIFGNYKFIILEGFWFKEKANFITWLDEVFIGVVWWSGLFVSCTEDDCIVWCWLELLHKPVDLWDSLRAFLRSDEVFDDSIAVLLYLFVDVLGDGLHVVLNMMYQKNSVVVNNGRILILEE